MGFHYLTWSLGWKICSTPSLWAVRDLRTIERTKLQSPKKIESVFGSFKTSGDSVGKSAFCVEHTHFFVPTINRWLGNVDSTEVLPFHVDCYATMIDRHRCNTLSRTIRFRILDENLSSSSILDRVFSLT